MRIAKRFNSYTLGIFFSTLVGIALLIPLLIAHYLSLGDSLPEWLVELILEPMFVSSLISGSGYVAKGLDCVATDKTALHLILKTRPTLKQFKQDLKNKISVENASLIAGLCAAVGIEIFRAVTHVLVPYVSVVGHTAASVITGSRRR